MATQTKEIILQVSSAYGGSNAPRTYREAASETFVKGEIVWITNGYVQEIASDTPGAILGIANQDASNDTTAGTSNVSVTLAQEGILFAANLLDASLADYVIQNKDLGRVAALQRDTTNSKVFLDASVAGGANARVFIHGLARDNAIGDTNARVLFEFLPQFVQNRSTS